MRGEGTRLEEGVHRLFLISIDITELKQRERGDKSLSWSYVSETQETIVLSGVKDHWGDD